MPTVTASLAALASAAPVVPGARGARTGRRREVWGTTWRLLVSVLLGGGLFVAMAVVPPRPAGWSVAVDVVLGVAVIGLLPWRRRWPFALAILAAVASGFSVLGVGAAGIIVISHATRRRWRRAAGGGGGVGRGGGGAGEHAASVQRDEHGVHGVG
ncbi:hypothetical protein [Cellulomonas soli]